MNKAEEIQLVKKILNLNRSRWVIKDMLFNPAFIRDFVELAQLKTFGFSYTITEVESDLGTILAAELISPDKDTLNLGAVRISGKETVIQDDLQTFAELDLFIESKLQEQR